MENNKKNRSLIIVLIFAVFILIICALGDMVINYQKENIPGKTVETITKEEVNITDEGIALAVNKVYDAAVIVKVYSGNTLSAWGSGFVYKSEKDDGYILTNHHVIDGASKIVVEFSDETTVDATLVGSDNYADVAVLKVPSKNIKKIAEIGSSEKLRLGDTVFAVGTPISLSYKFTVTRGILSGKDRLVQMTESNKYQGFFQQYQNAETWYMNLIQIDASINSGNSGGPLANANGEVVGITNSKLSNSSVGASIENMGFAIPIEFALSMAEKIENGKSLERPVLGVGLMNVEDAKNGNVKVDSTAKYGAVITEVSKDSNASRAGLKVGDVIVSIDGKKVEDYKYLKYYLFNHCVGDTVEFGYIRNGKTNTVKITFKN